MPQGMGPATAQRSCGFCGEMTPCDRISYVMLDKWVPAFCCDDCFKVNPRFVQGELCGICLLVSHRTTMHRLEEPLRIRRPEALRKLEEAFTAGTGGRAEEFDEFYWVCRHCKARFLDVDRLPSYFEPRGEKPSRVQQIAG